MISPLYRVDQVIFLDVSLILLFLSHLNQHTHFHSIYGFSIVNHAEVMTDVIFKRVILWSYIYLWIIMLMLELYMMLKRVFERQKQKHKHGFMTVMKRKNEKKLELISWLSCVPYWFADMYVCEWKRILRWHSFRWWQGMDVDLSTKGKRPNKSISEGGLNRESGCACGTLF